MIEVFVSSMFGTEIAVDWNEVEAVMPDARSGNTVLCGKSGRNFSVTGDFDDLLTKWRKAKGQT